MALTKAKRKPRLKRDEKGWFLQIGSKKVYVVLPNQTSGRISKKVILQVIEEERQRRLKKANRDRLKKTRESEPAVKDQPRRDLRRKNEPKKNPLQLDQLKILQGELKTQQSAYDRLRKELDEARRRERIQADKSSQFQIARRIEEANKRISKLYKIGEIRDAVQSQLISQGVNVREARKQASLVNRGMLSDALADIVKDGSILSADVERRVPNEIIPALVRKVSQGQAPPQAPAPRPPPPQAPPQASAQASAPVLRPDSPPAQQAERVEDLGSPLIREGREEAQRQQESIRRLQRSVERDGEPEALQFGADLSEGRQNPVDLPAERERVE
jgi:hypothetical protein